MLCDVLCDVGVLATVLCVTTVLCDVLCDVLCVVGVLATVLCVMSCVL